MKNYEFDKNKLIFQSIPDTTENDKPTQKVNSVITFKNEDLEIVVKT